MSFEQQFEIVPSNPEERDREEETETQTFFESAETSATFEEAVNTIAQNTLATLEEKFKPAEEEEGFAYHNIEHTKKVMERVSDILREIRDAVPDAVSERDIGLGTIAASEHDVYQLYRPTDKEDGSQFRQRFTGDNEAVSAYDAIQQMQQMNEQYDEEIFSRKDMERISEAINATTPGFDPDAGTVVQPQLSEESDVITRALALADIGGAGIEGKAFLEEGDRLFREENLDIDKAIHSEEQLSADQKEAMRQRMLAWSKNQIPFIKGRQAHLDNELEGLPPRAQDALRDNIFTGFNEAIEAAQQSYERRQDMSFEELAKDMGYTFPEERHAN